jgi:hypothetical protein
MLCVEFEPTIPASERAKRVHTLDRAATVTGPCRFIPKKTTPVTHWIGRGVGFGAGLDVTTNRNISFLSQESIPDSLNISGMTDHY